MTAVRLTEKLVISTQTETRDSAGAIVEGALVAFATVFCQPTPVYAAERYESNRTIAVRAYKFMIRYLSGVLETMICTYDGQNYQITGIAEVGRREYLQLTAELIK